MINVGIAGIGFMGVTHFDAWEASQSGRVAAISTRDQKKLSGDWSGVQGNFGDAGGVRDLSSLRKYADLSEMYTDPDLDVIDICLPTPLHREAVINAMLAGKHVILEKPISLTLDDADAMLEVAEKTGKLFFVAQVLRVWPEWAYLKTLMESGELGKLLSLNVRRIISKPNWSKHIGDFASNGGPLIDLHIHDTDFVLYLLGKPKRVHSIGRQNQGAVTFVATNYDYGSEGPTVSAQCGAASTAGRPFMHGYEANFENATVSYAVGNEVHKPDVAQGRSISQALTIYHPDRTEHPTVKGEDGFAAELRHAAECIEKGVKSTIIDAAQARDSLAVVLAEGESVRTGKVCEID